MKRKPTLIAIALIVMIIAVSMMQGRVPSGEQDDLRSTEESGVMTDETGSPESDLPLRGTYFLYDGELADILGKEADELYENAFSCVEEKTEFEHYRIEDGVLLLDEYAETGEQDEDGVYIYEWKRNQQIADDVIYVDFNGYRGGQNTLYITRDNVLHGIGDYEDVYLEDVRFARAYADQLLALKTDGSLWCKGRLFSLSDGRELVYQNWQHVLSDVVYASVGHYLYMAITSDGSLYMWGDNTYGQFGDGSLLKEDSGFKADTYFYMEPVKVADGIRMVWHGIPGEQYSAELEAKTEGEVDLQTYFLTETDELYVSGENVGDEIRTFSYFGELGPVEGGIQVQGTSQLYPVISRKGEKLSEEELEELNIAYEELIVPGLDREYHLFFMADSHVSLCDERDPEVSEKAAQRRAVFTDENGVDASETFEKLVKASNTLGADMFIMGGDVIDSAMYASIDSVKDSLAILDAPYLYNLGNHDFEYGLEYFSDAAYSIYLPRLNGLRNGSGCQIVEFDDFVVVAVDDKNNQVDISAVEGLEKAVKTGKPVIVVMHVPFEPLTGDDSLLQDSINVWMASGDGRSGVIIGENGCMPNEDTRRFREILLAENSPVQLVLGGHIHFYHKDSLNGEVMQIVTGPAYQKHAVYITLKPEE